MCAAIVVALSSAGCSMDSAGNVHWTRPPTNDDPEATGVALWRPDEPVVRRGGIRFQPRGVANGFTGHCPE